MVKHKTLPAGVDQVGFGGITPSLYAEEHAFSGGTQGAVLVRNTLTTDGSSWAATIAGVLVSAGVNNLPTFSATLPNAVQDNITRLGAVVSGSFNAGAVTTTALVVNGTITVTGAATMAAISATSGTFSTTLSVTSTATFTNVITTQALALQGEINPGSLGADTHNWAPTGIANALCIRITSSLGINLTGITTGAVGRILVLFNAGSFNIVLQNNSGSSTAANRFSLPAASVTILPLQARTVRYDGTLLNWTLTSYL